MHRRVVLISALLAAGFGASVAVESATAAGEASAPVKVTVTMSDFKFRLSVKSVPRGRPIVFTVINRGPSPHDFDLSGTKGTPVILPGRRTTQRVTFRSAGNVRYVCTVPRHAQYGMLGRLPVK